MSGRLRIIVTGLIGQHPLLGGMAWHYAQYVLGLARLGHDVHYIEDSGEWPYNLDGGPSGADYSATDSVGNVRHLAAVMDGLGLATRWAYHCPISGRWFGLADGRRAEILRSADLLLNVSGTLADPAPYRSVARLAYIDTDPVFTQIKLARGPSPFRAAVEAHDVHFSFGESMGDAAGGADIRWRPTRQPVVLSEWRPGRPPGDAYTTVMNWSSYRCEEHEGRLYGQKDIEFERFLDLPAAVAPIALELSVRGTLKGSLPGDVDERAPGDLVALLRRRGWRVVDAIERCGSHERYRDYIEGARGEWTVAKNAYVAGRSGWFSDRSACYLAAGRPVVTQDTGFTAHLPAGEGLLAFADPAEAAEALRAVEGAYARHARAARALAEAHFDAETVLSRLVEQCTTGLTMAAAS